MTAGVTAYLRGERRGAEHIWRTLVDRSSVLSAEAAFNLGVLLKKQGHPKEAEEAYRQAIDSEHSDTAPMAAFNLGFLLKEQGHPEEAERAFQQAIDSRDSEDIVRSAEQAPKQLRTSRSEKDI